MKANRSTILIGVNDVSQSHGKSINLKKSEIDYRLMLNRSGVSKPDSEGCFNGSLCFADDSFKLRIQKDHGPAEIEKIGKIVARLIKKCRTIQKIFDQAAQEVSTQQWIWDGYPRPQGQELIARN